MKNRHSLLIPIVAAAFAVAACAQSTQPAQEIPDAPGATVVIPSGPTAVIDTSMGRITCRFYQKQAPMAVANFIALAQGTKDWTDPATKTKRHNKPYFDGTIFHRVIPEFMIQGGDPTGTGMGDPGYSFNDEFDPDLKFDKPGRLAMANAGPNTNGGQFFITEIPTEFLNHKHTIFGQCDDASVELVKAIARVPRDGQDKPLTPVVLKKVTIVPEGKPLPPIPGEAQMQNSAPNVDRTKRLNISGGVAAKMIASKVSPTYPPDAKAAGTIGTVVLDAIIGIDGHVKELTVVQGPQGLQGAALDAVRQWVYHPFLLNGDPIEFRTTINVIFTLGK